MNLIRFVPSRNATQTSVKNEPINRVNAIDALNLYRFANTARLEQKAP